jgi:hypothetical protein
VRVAVCGGAASGGALNSPRIISTPLNARTDTFPYHLHNQSNTVSSHIFKPAPIENLHKQLTQTRPESLGFRVLRLYSPHLTQNDTGLLQEFQICRTSWLIQRRSWRVRIKVEYMLVLFLCMRFGFCLHQLTLCVYSSDQVCGHGADSLPTRH